MKNKVLMLVAAIGLTAFSAPAGHQADGTLQQITRGRSGYMTIAKVSPAPPTVAIYRGGQAVGRVHQSDKVHVRPQWHNPSRPTINSQAVVFSR